MSMRQVGPLLFNIDLCDLFSENYSSDFVNFADDTTPYECGPTLNKIMNNLEITTENMFEIVQFQQPESKASIYHLLISPYQPVWNSNPSPSLQVFFKEIHLPHFYLSLWLTIFSDKQMTRMDLKHMLKTQKKIFQI